MYLNKNRSVSIKKMQKSDIKNIKENEYKDSSKYD